MNDDETPPSPWGPRPDKGLNNSKKPNRPYKSSLKKTSRLPVFLVGVIGFLFILLIASWLLPDHMIAGASMGGLMYDGLLLAFVGAGLWAHVSSSPSAALRHLATWVIIFGVLALGYSIWTGGGRIGGELDVAKGVSTGTNISYRADQSGHFFVRARVNGTPVVFMVDTGATDVALTRVDAENIGLPMDQLSFTKPYKTANGTTYGAQVMLATIDIGPIRVKNITGSVLPDGLGYSLLGMSFLNTLSGYKVVNGVLTLYP
ncbi:MAG: hypothetical protein COA93_00655 [Alphaproteobacteria bacterium]|nr:MAG: hypothetical protein COA93_00655 [Alphaproteobacteria bacterium]